MNAECMICGINVEEAKELVGSYSTGFYGVCPTCRRHAEIGKRVEGMSPMKEKPYHDYRDGWNDCLSEAKGVKAV